MSEKIYLSVGFEMLPDAGDELYLFEQSGRVFGYSSEFDICTYDIAAASSVKTASTVTWFAWRKEFGFVPASIDVIRSHNLLRYVIGYRTRVDMSEDIKPVDL